MLYYQFFIIVFIRERVREIMLQYCYYENRSTEPLLSTLAVRLEYEPTLTQNLCHFNLQASSHDAQST